MPGLTHIGLAFIAKVIFPSISLWLLFLATEMIDLIFILFLILGIERTPDHKDGKLSAYSHGLLMATIWTILSSTVVWLISKDGNLSLIFGGMMFSHWILDYIASPMIYTFPNDTGVPIFFQNSKKIGLGMWKSKKAVNIGEYGITLFGIGIYLISIL